MVIGADPFRRARPRRDAGRRGSRPPPPRAAGRLAPLERAASQFTIVTGRMFAAARPFARTLGIDGPIVCYQGAAIFDVASGCDAAPDARAPRRHARHAAMGARRAACTRSATPTTRCTSSRSTASRSATRSSRASNRCSCRRCARRSPSGRRSRSSSSTTPDRSEAHLTALRALLGARAYLTRSHVDFVEVVDPAVNKGEALAFVAQRYGVDASTRRSPSATRGTTCRCWTRPRSASRWAPARPSCSRTRTTSSATSRTTASPKRSSGTCCDEGRHARACAAAPAQAVARVARAPVLDRRDRRGRARRLGRRAAGRFTVVPHRARRRRRTARIAGVGRSGAHRRGRRAGHERLAAQPARDRRTHRGDSVRRSRDRAPRSVSEAVRRSRDRAAASVGMRVHRANAT